MSKNLIAIIFCDNYFIFDLYQKINA